MLRFLLYWEEERKECTKRRNFCQKVEESFPEIIIKRDSINFNSSLKFCLSEVNSLGKCKNVFVCC